MESQASTSTNETSSSPSTFDHRTNNAETFLHNMARMVERSDVRQMVDLQKHMMLRYEKTNEMLLNFNVLSSNRYQTSVEEFKKHTQVMGEMKKDLDSIFKRIRKLKGNLNSQFPDAFHQSVENLKEDDDVTPKMSASDSVDIRQVIHEEPEAEVGGARL